MIVSEEIQKDRLQKCLSCPFKRNEIIFLWGLIKIIDKKQCKKCKCPIDNKVKFSFSECPENRWEK